MAPNVSWRHSPIFGRGARSCVGVGRTDGELPDDGAFEVVSSVEVVV
jgi:hypothetical protein